MEKRIGDFILLGTSHISKKSSHLVRYTIEKERPQIVALELDIRRLQSLLSSKKTTPPPKDIIKKLGIIIGSFVILASKVQQKLGENLNIVPGTDMKTGYLTARKNNFPIALIDIPIEKTFSSLSNLSLKRKVSLLFSIFTKGLKKKYRENLYFNYRRDVPNRETLIKIIKFLKREIPDLYEVLIEKRNKYMCKKLLSLREKHPGTIVAVVGAAHIPGMYKILKKSIKKPTNSIEVSFTLNLEQNHQT